MSCQAHAKLKELGLTLPQAVAPVANYVPYVITGNTVMMSGMLPMQDGKPQYIGKLGDNISVEEGYEAAKLCGLNMLAQLEQAVSGNMDSVARVLKLGIFVNSTADFTDQPKVANGISDLMVNVFEDAGKHARFAMGAGQLPFGVAVEVDGVFELK